MSLKILCDPVVKSLTFRGQELLTKIDDHDFDFPHRTWKLSHVNFTITQLKEILGEALAIPRERLEVNLSPEMDQNAEYRLPKGFNLRWPKDGISQ